MSGSGDNLAVGYATSYKVKVGTVTPSITSTGGTETISFTYSNVGTAFSSVTDKLSFYYSVNPKSTSDSAGESTSATYGTLTASLS